MRQYARDSYCLGYFSKFCFEVGPGYTRRHFGLTRAAVNSTFKNSLPTIKYFDGDLEMLKARSRLARVAALPFILIIMFSSAPLSGGTGVSIQPIEIAGLSCPKAHSGIGPCMPNRAATCGDDCGISY